MADLKLAISRLQIKDFLLIFTGVLVYAIGYTAFILPEKVVMGGVSGVSALLYYATSFSPGYSIWILNFLMLFIAIKALTRQFIYRTVIGVTMLSVLVRLLQPLFMEYPLVTAGEDRFMHVLIGGVMCGAGLGLSTPTTVPREAPTLSSPSSTSISV